MSDSVNRLGSDEEWEQLLRQLRDKPKAQPKPFFYARVQARLAAELAPAVWLPSWARRPAYVALLGALVLAVSGDGAALRPTTLADQVGGYQSGQPARLLSH
jgi:hypothetical protein